MSSYLRMVVGVGLLAALAGCANDDWTYRPRDAAVAADTGPVTDAARVDVGTQRDAVTANDVTRSDGGMVGPDVGFIDAGLPTGDVILVVDTGAPATGLALRAQGFATVAGQSSPVGTLRLTETGFEIGDRACVGSLCLAGGLVP